MHRNFNLREFREDECDYFGNDFFNGKIEWDTQQNEQAGVENARANGKIHQKWKMRHPQIVGQNN